MVTIAVLPTPTTKMLRVQSDWSGVDNYSNHRIRPMDIHMHIRSDTCIFLVLRIHKRWCKKVSGKEYDDYIPIHQKEWFISDRENMTWRKTQSSDRSQFPMKRIEFLIKQQEINRNPDVAM